MVSTTSTVLTYTKGGLSPYAGQPFKFRVLAQNFLGFSNASDSVRILAASVPGVPGTPTKVESTKDYLKIRWTAPSFNGGVPIDAYSVYGTVKNGVYQKLTTTGDLGDLSYKFIITAD
jgi:hypothetical protein